jgi:hypothetical protein
MAAAGLFVQQGNILSVTAYINPEKHTQKRKTNMIKIDPIIAVTDVEASSRWYQQVFEVRRTHGGKGRFAVLAAANNDILLCLYE